MKIGLILPGIRASFPVWMWLTERLARGVELHVFALRQEWTPMTYPLCNATIHAIAPRPRRVRAVTEIVREHRVRSFDCLHAFFAVPYGYVARLASLMIGVPFGVHIAGGEPANVPEIDYGGARTPRGRVL